MDCDQSNRQLNGYKFSFNRVNPYFDCNIQICQPERGDFYTKEQSKGAIDAKNDIERSHNISSFKLVSLTQDTQISQNSMTKTQCKKTKQSFYNKMYQNEKNKILVNLYLQKTKFKKTKPQLKCLNVKQKILSMNKTHSDIPYMTQRVHVNQLGTKEEQGQSASYLTEASTTQREKVPSPQSSQTKRHPSRNFRVNRNFSQNRFHVYLQSPKHLAKFKVSGTSPLQKLDKPDGLKNVSSFVVEPQSEQTNKKRKTKRNFTLRIRTQTEIELNDIIQLNQEQLKTPTPKINNQVKKSNLGVIKCKSPRFLLSPRNQLFIKKKEASKIKLFTHEQQEAIVQQFYSQEKISQTKK